MSCLSLPGSCGKIPFIKKNRLLSVGKESFIRNGPDFEGLKKMAIDSLSCLWYLNLDSFYNR
jgi:hypothetical protein